MKMMNLVAPLEHLDAAAREIVLLGNVHIVNALHEVDESNFSLPVAEENIDKLKGLIFTRPYPEDEGFKATAGKADTLMHIFGFKPEVKDEYLTPDYRIKDDIEWVEQAYKEVLPLHEGIMTMEDRMNSLEEMEGCFEDISGSDVDLKLLTGLQYFNYKMGILSRENRLRLKQNYENIVAVVFKTGSSRRGDVYLIISPAELEIETERILRTLNFYRLEIPEELLGTYRQIRERITGKKKQLRLQLKEHRRELYRLKKKLGERLYAVHSRMAMEEEISVIKKETACSGSYFYLSGWVPAGETGHITGTLKGSRDNVYIMFKEAAEVNEYLIPPTRLKNNRLLKPFETLVKMYGIPSYNEADPTAFLSITYMVLFGAMFGDVGHGLVLLLAGVFAGRKPASGPAGGILARLGVSSLVFGLVYGSVFGFEDAIPALLIKPIENINSMLLGSVVLGVLLLIVSFGYGIRNAMGRRDLKEGLFGRNGLAGLLFYLTLLALVLNAAAGIRLIPNGTGLFLLAVLMAVIVMREPLANWITGRPGSGEDAAGYYIESGFGVLETLLAMFSSTISFIRVGAFALNHVGLSIAVETMAEMAKNAAGSVLVYIIGNAIIIGLEGLIVFIQGLRLEYYEMFGKYYRGEGVEFQPAGIHRQ